MSSFEKFIEDKTAPGLLDAPGTFTISGEKALEKFSKYTFENPAEWILKMVQAAVAGFASRLSIRTTRSTVSLTFYSPAPPDPELLREALLNPAVQVEDMAAELLPGLRSQLLHRDLLLEWSDGKALAWDGREITSGQVRQTQGGAPFRITIKPTAARLRLLRGRLDFAPEVNLLRRRATFCPLVISLNGRSLHYRDLAPESGNPRKEHAKFSPRNLCVGAFTVTEQGDVRLGPGPEVDEGGFLRDGLRGPTPFLHWNPSELTSRHGNFHLFMSYALSEQTGHSSGFLPLTETFRVVWTRLGVVSAELSFPYSGFGGAVQLGGDHLSSDITGLNLDLGEETARAGELVKQVLEGVMPDLVASITEHETRTDRQDILEGLLSLGIAGGLTGYVAGAALLQLSGPGLLALTTFGGLAGASVSRKDLPNIKGWLCRHLVHAHSHLVGRL